MSPSDSIEASAATVEQAISQALDQLGAHQDDVTIEVLSTPRSGVLGLGVRPARVRVSRRAPEVARSTVQSPPPAPPLKRTPPESARVTPPRPEPRRAPEAAPVRSRAAEPVRQEQPEDQAAAPETQPSRLAERPSRDTLSDNRRRPRDERPAPRHERGDNRPQDYRDDQPSAQRDDRQQELRQEPRSDRSDERRSDRVDGPSPARPRRDRRPRSSSGDARTGNAPRGGDRPLRDDAPSASSSPEQEADFGSFNDDGSDGENRNVVAPEEQVREAIAILAQVLEMMGEKAEIETVRDDSVQTVELNVKGDGSGILIGRHGQTLDALEYMVNRILGRRIKDAVAIAIDTESYRARRRGQLHRLALSKGEQAKREHITVKLDPMPPRDRRIVHLALKDDPMITTRSSGEGFLRSIEITPVDDSRDRGERSGRERRGRDRDDDRDRAPLGQQGGFKHGQKRIV
ncbi:MAG: RNA-binding cell elongation regulator Jag/EloR [Candidatus Binataceae bacterium]|jgi:spoIIIJ-associated protein